MAEFDTLTLPDYRELPSEVQARLDEIATRRVVLDVEHLTRIYPGEDAPRLVLNDVSFQVRKREFISVIGPSGCGKSTLIRLLAGLDQPSSGQIRVDEIAVEGPGADRGMVFQGYTLFPWLTVKQNVMFGPSLNSSLAARSERKAADWLKLVGLDDYADAYPAELSGGMKQRVAIARALANSPRVLFMDEPFGALDAQTRCKMQQHLLEIWEHADVTILFITHDLDEAIYLSDRIIVLGARPGRIVETVNVPVPRPRRSRQLLSPHFLATKQRLEALIHGDAPYSGERLNQDSARLREVNAEMKLGETA